MKLHYVQTGDVQIKSRHQLARFTARPARAFDVLRDPNWSPRLPIGCWLIEHPEGLIMVDTGESSHANDPGYQPWWHPFMQTCERRWVKPEEEAGAQVRTFGFDPFNVRWVVMTHMHSDHAGGIPNFPQSEFVLSAPEAAASLSWTGPVNGFLNMHYPEWFKPRTVEHTDGTWESFERSTKLTQDGRVRIVPTPGHTNGHQSVVIEQDDHLVLIAGDASYGERAMLDGSVDGVAQDFAAHRDTTRRLRELCQRHSVITQFAHDPDCATRLEQKRFTPVP
jgi:N-acyl homoserine lactone hydrolase